MRSNGPTRWTIDELGAQAALALSVDYDGAPNSRIRDVPDRRTIRYYTTLGLLDRPAEMRGRTALYDTRHLLQLVAIKRLQAKGLSLGEVQHQLLGLTDAALRRLARVPDLDTTNQPAPPQPSDTSPTRRDGAFWASSPAPVADPQPTEEAATEAPAGDAVLSAPAPAGPAWQGVPVGDNVLLLFDPARPLEPDDLAAIRVAAGPLLHLLHARRLLRPRHERGTS